jgi:hypothetical protein
LVVRDRDFLLLLFSLFLFFSSDGVCCCLDLERGALAARDRDFCFFFSFFCSSLPMV